MPYSAPNIVFRMRWMIGIALLAIAASTVALTGSRAALPAADAPVAAAETLPSLNPALADLAARSPHKRVEVIVQLNPGTARGAAAPLVRELGGKVTRDLHIINAVAAELPAAGARELASRPEVRAVSPNAATKSQATGDGLATSYNASIQTPYLWNTYRGTGRGVGVAVVDTGIAGDLPDFRASSLDKSSRVIASAVVNPDAKTAGDRYGHGTHVAGIIAGDSRNRDDGDANKGRFMGVAPAANLISIKASDDDGNATVLDVIAGIQFAVDHKADYNIRVLNLSLESSATESYKTDPLDAAVEAAWFKGIFVVAAAGNRGPGGDSVSHAPGNDPYVVTVGAVDDKGTKEIADDEPTSWSSRGTTQDGFAKPDIYAPGAKIVSNLAPGSTYSRPLHRLRQRRRRVHPRRRHLDVRPDGGGRRRDRLPARPDADAEPRQGAAARLRSPADRLDRRAQHGRRRPPLLRRRRQARQPGPRRRTVHRPGDGRDRLHPLELEPLALERGRRAAALELEPLELEPGSGLARDRQRGRRHRALELEPLELVDQLDQVTLARGPERTARPGIAWARRDSARLVSPHRS